MSPPPKVLHRGGCPLCHTFGGGDNCHPPPPLCNTLGGGDNCHPPPCAILWGGVTIVTPPPVQYFGGG